MINQEKIKTREIIYILLPENVEEIVSLYLQKKEDYLIYTSTNKIDTKKYEFVMIKKDGKEKCYVQVKTGDSSLNPDDFKELLNNKENQIEKKVYLFSVNENYEKKENSHENIICLKKQDLLDFIYKNKNILPERIRRWMDYLENC